MSWTVVPAVAGDAAQLEAVDPDWDEGTARAFLERPPGVGFVARGTRGGILGFIVGQSAGGEAEIVQITVAEAARRGGIGTALLEAFLAANAGKACFLEVREDNAPAIAFYSRHGFTPDRVRKGYYRGPEGAVDALAMRLDTTGAGD